MFSSRNMYNQTINSFRISLSPFLRRRDVEFLFLEEVSLHWEVPCPSSNFMCVHIEFLFLEEVYTLLRGVEAPPVPL